MNSRSHGSGVTLECEKESDVEGVEFGTQILLKKRGGVVSCIQMHKSIAGPGSKSIAYWIEVVVPFGHLFGF